MLQRVNRLQRPIVSREVKVSVDIAAIFPVGREAAHPLINGAFLDPEIAIGPQLQVQRFVSAGHFVRSISESNLHNVQHDVRARLQMKPEITEGFPSPLPAVRV